tara:strand:- start:458 stop:970 length:513 start_codon:yes stop_codon:yes gene_type:complete
MNNLKLIFLFLLFGNGIVFSQDRPLNNIGINLVGDASHVSIHYEKLQLTDKSYIFGYKLGIGYNQEFQLCIFGPCSSPAENYLTIPHHVTANLGTSKSFFEFGLGGTMLVGETKVPYIFYPILGYRFLPLYSNKLNFRIYFQPPVQFVDGPTGHPEIPLVIGGMSIGFSF